MSDDATPERTIDRLTRDNERLRGEIGFALSDLNGILIFMIGDTRTPAEMEAALEKTVERLDRAVKR